MIPCRALSLIEIEQNGAGGKRRVRNDRILAIPIEARREKELRTARSLPKRVRDEIEHFMIAATVFEGKDAKILRWAGPSAAIELLLIRRSPSGRPFTGMTHRAGVALYEKLEGYPSC